MKVHVWSLDKERGRWIHTWPTRFPELSSGSHFSHCCWWCHYSIPW